MNLGRTHNPLCDHSLRTKYAWCQIGCVVNVVLVPVSWWMAVGSLVHAWLQAGGGVTVIVGCETQESSADVISCF